MLIGPKGTTWRGDIFWIYEGEEVREKFPLLVHKGVVSSAINIQAEFKKWLSDHVQTGEAIEITIKKVEDSREA